MLFLIQITIGPMICVFLLYILLNYLIKGEKNVCVVVIGDIGHSPRMQYHSISLTQEGFSVDLVGYKGSLKMNQTIARLIHAVLMLQTVLCSSGNFYEEKWRSQPHKCVRENSKIELSYIREVPSFIRGFPRLVSYVFKVIWQFFSLSAVLLLLPKSGFILLQNPPSLPSIAVCYMVCMLRRSKLIIDWHNYGYTILALTLGNEHPLVRISKWYEGFFGWFASAHICVTKAMKEDLSKNWNIQAETMYDKSPPLFKEVSLEEKHEIFQRLKEKYPAFGNKDSAFTEIDSSDKIVEKNKRPAFLVSSTSWTEDEDFSILLDALEKYEKTVCDSGHLPDIVCCITGKGPLKAFYENEIKSKQWKHVKVVMPWLEAEDYPVLLGSADLGICLHKSSSGLDLPMKVVDMFGCNVPVCAINYNCIHELVIENKNGLIFKDSKELIQQIQDLLSQFYLEENPLKRMKEYLRQNWTVRWHDEWQAKVLPLF